MGVSSPREVVREGKTVETGFVRSFRHCSVGGVPWVVRSYRGGGLCRPRTMMILEATSFPPILLAAWRAPGWSLARLRVGILNPALPSFCGKTSSAEKASPGRGCAFPIPCSSVSASGCSCPSPRGGSRATRVMPWELIFAFFVGSCVNCKVVGAFPCSSCSARSSGFFCRFFLVKPSCFRPIPRLGCSYPGTILCLSLGFAFVMGCVGCRVHGTKVSWGVDSHRTCRLLLPACSYPSSRGWCCAVWAKRWSLILAFSTRACKIVGAFSCFCSISRSTGFLCLFLMGSPGCS